MVRLLTFTCYGSHLPGDARGSFDHVRQGERRFLFPTPALERYSRAQTTQAPYLLSTVPARAAVRDAIAAACRFRSWFLYALHVRTNHVHGVAESEAPADRILHDWKAYATRALRAAGLASPGQFVWTHGGSAHNLISRKALTDAVRYVIEGQGEPMEIYFSEPDREPPP
jgi:REP element-mobilizing transposase RayT